MRNGGGRGSKNLRFGIRENALCSTGAQIDANKAAFVAREQETIGQRRIGPRFETEDLGARRRFELLRGCRGFDQLALFGEKQQVAASESYGAGAKPFHTPHGFAGL